MSRREPVDSYADWGKRFWAIRLQGHGSACPCLVCADYRKYLGWPDRQATPVNREERAS